LLERAGRFGLCVHTETPPYEYVSGEGPIVAIATADVERDLRPLARRYLGPEGATLTSPRRERSTSTTCSYACGPERWLTVDYAKDACS